MSPQYELMYVGVIAALRIHRSGDCALHQILNDLGCVLDLILELDALLILQV